MIFFVGQEGLGQTLWGRNWPVFLPHKTQIDESPVAEPVGPIGADFVGQELASFLAPQNLSSEQMIFLLPNDFGSAGGAFLFQFWVM